MALSQATSVEIDPARIAQVAERLPPKPRGYGPPCQDQEAWMSPAIVRLLGKTVTRATELLGRPFPPRDDEAYLEYFRTGSRHPSLVGA